jgi:hypothetical protein
MKRKIAAILAAGVVGYSKLAVRRLAIATTGWTAAVESN